MRPSARQRGVTILEVVLAVVLLSMVASFVVTAIGSVEQGDAYNVRRLGAYELAHRLVMIHLDEEERLPNASLPLDYGQHKYFWDLEEGRVLMVLPREVTESGGGPNVQALNRFREVVIKVYRADESGKYPQRAELLAEISRVYDPFAPRNPDAMERLASNPDRIAVWLRMLTGLDIYNPVRPPTGGGNGSGGGTGNGNRNGSGSGGAGGGGR